LEIDWKFVDDLTLSETISKNQLSQIQTSVNKIQAWSQSNLAELNEEKCKEIQIDFSRNKDGSSSLPPVLV
jgi:hypothetical protein